MSLGLITVGKRHCRLLYIIPAQPELISTATDDLNRPFVALQCHYQQNPSGIRRSLKTQWKKILRTIFDIQIFTSFFYDSLQKLPMAISLLFAIK